MPKRSRNSRPVAKRRLYKNTLVENICQLAINEDLSALLKLREEGECLSSFLDHRDAIMLLIERREFYAVDFLINYFKGNINHAASCYAFYGLEIEVEKLLAQGASRSSALWGYAAACNLARVNLMVSQGEDINIALIGLAEGGHVNEVEIRMRQGADPSYALIGYAYGGHFDHASRLIESGVDSTFALSGASKGYYLETLNYVNVSNYNIALLCYAISGNITASYISIMNGADCNAAVKGFAIRGDNKQVQACISLFGASPDHALSGYAQGGHIDQVNDLVKKGANRRFAIDGYKCGGLLNSLSVLRLLVFTEDSLLQSMLVNSIKEVDPTIDMGAIRYKAYFVKDTMAYYQIGYQHALSLVENRSIVWLLKGLQVMTDNHMPPEIFFIITSFVFDLSLRDVLRIHSATNLNCHRNVGASGVKNCARFFPCSTSRNAVDDADEVILLNCNPRP